MTGDFLLPVAEGSLAYYGAKKSRLTLSKAAHNY